MTQKIALEFLRGCGVYNAKDIAGFDPDHAEKLIEQGFAQKAAIQPKATLIAQLGLDAPDIKAMVNKAVADLRAEIEGDIAAREAKIEGDKESLEQAWLAYEAKVEDLNQREQAAAIRLEDLAKREADLEARITAMTTNVNVTVDANGEVQAVVQSVSEEAAKPKATGLPKQGK